MADEALSQAEVESLLSSIHAGAAATFPQAAASSRELVQPYDFTRPQRLRQIHKQALHRHHEGFCRNFAAALSALLRSVAEVKLAGIEQIAFGEFTGGLEVPTYLCVLRAEPLDGPLLLDISPSILFPVIDRLLGGGRDERDIVRRPLTEIELRLAGRITQLLLRELRKAWEIVRPLELSVDRIESNPRLVQNFTADEPLARICFEISLGECGGPMTLCLPCSAIEQVSGKLVSSGALTLGVSPATPQSAAHISRQLDRSLVEVVVTLAGTKIGTGDLIGLRVGDVIATGKDIHSPLEVAVEGSSKFLAFAGALDGHKAVQIESAMPVPDATAA